jgi:tRNA1(Val) A37 N6-methylase TrmN6
MRPLSSHCPKLARTLKIGGFDFLSYQQRGPFQFSCDFYILLASSSWLTQFTVLEIGTFISFSALCWFEAVGPSGHVTTLEFSPEYASKAEKEFEKNGIKNIEVLIGDANESQVQIFPMWRYLPRRR